VSSLARDARDDLDTRHGAEPAQPPGHAGR
jgi:hypothetical protein